MYWKCCEERFCFDDKIATYRFEETPTTVYSNGYANMGASLDSIVTQQPSNNNHLPQNANLERETNDLPFNANVLYEVFSKSMIFRNEFELKSSKSTVSLEEVETKSEPDLSDKPNRTKVYFEDEVNSPVTDFEIMFKDELGSGNMFKIAEEEEDKTEDRGLTINVSVKKQDVVKPTTVTMKDETKITTINPIYKYDPTTAVPTLKTALSLPRVENLKGILRQRKELSRTASTKTLEEEISVEFRSKESPKVDPSSINKVLARVPNRSASFLNIPEHLMPERPPLTKSKSTIGVISLEETEFKIGRLPDTPIIKSNNLPRFFAESPIITEYKGDTSLQSIKRKEDMTFKENDFSMPRYGRMPSPVEPVYESKSMPDLRGAGSTGKVSKRLVKFRSKLKPLVIKKGTDEKL